MLKSSVRAVLVLSIAFSLNKPSKTQKHKIDKLQKDPFQEGPNVSERSWFNMFLLELDQMRANLTQPKALRGRVTHS